MKKIIPLLLTLPRLAGCFLDSDSFRIIKSKSEAKSLLLDDAFENV